MNSLGTKRMLLARATLPIQWNVSNEQKLSQTEQKHKNKTNILVNLQRYHT